MNSAGTGNYSSGATWVGGVAPSSSDPGFILSGHTVTLDTTSCVASSVTVNSGGTLTCATGVSTALTTGHSIVNNGTVNLSVTSDPAITCTVTLNAANLSSAPYGTLKNVGDAVMIMQGFFRKRYTTTTTLVPVNSTGTRSATLSDATGWQVGDRVIFATTAAYSATPATDIVTLTAVAGNVISWDAAATPTAYSHAIGGYVGNFTSNLVVKGHASAAISGVWLDNRYSGNAGQKLFSNVLFEALIAPTYFEINHAMFRYNDEGGSISAASNLTISSCAAYQNSGGFFLTAYSPVNVDGLIYYSSVARADSSNAAVACGEASSGSTINGVGVFRTNFSGASSSGIEISSGGTTLSNSFVSGVGSSSAGLRLGSTAVNLSNVETFSNGKGVQTGSGTATGSLLIGLHNGGVATNSNPDTHGPIFNLTIVDGGSQTVSLTGLSGAIDAASMTFVNRWNGSAYDVTAQEIYRPFMSIKRDNSNFSRSTSSVAIGPTRISKASQRELKIPCANGSSIRVIGRVKKSHSTNISATVALSGLGSAWGGFTKANDTSWQQYDTGVITNSSGADGNFTLTYTANSSSGTTNVVYFDGVPDAPFVTKCRHYGYTFDEANPSRTANAAIQEATEAAALAYTNITIAGTTVLSPVSIGASKTFQQVYDYSQAYACSNLTYTPSFTATGSAGVPALIALANVTTTGFTLDGGGSLAMGAYTLTADQPWAYTYTGGTFSQGAGSGLPVFSGGTLQITTTGTKTLNMTGGQITFSAVGTYVMSASTLASSVGLVNTSGGAVTVQVASGQSYTNTGPNITVSAPVLYQTVTISGAIAGSIIQIYDTTSSTELYNGSPTFPYTWTDSVGASSSRAIRLRVAKVSGTTAHEFIEANIGTCGITSGDAAVSYLVSQALDTTYNSNAIDGPATYAGSGITFTDASPDRVNCNIAGGSVTYPTIYSCFVYWSSTTTGIANDFTYIDAPDTANYLFSGMKIRNTSATDLVVTGGYGRDATSGLSKDIIDTAGSTGNIFLAPDHVVPYQTTGTYAITGDINTILTAVSAVPAGVLSAATAAPIAANIEQVNAQTISGTGTAGDPWGP